MTMGWPNLAKDDRCAVRCMAVLAAIAALMGAGCSFERAFCTSDSLSCAAEADYNWVAEAQ